MSEETPRTDSWETYYFDSEDLSRELELENNELRELVRLLTIQEMSDSGRLFYPTSISSCRCMDLEKIGEITEKYRKTPHITTGHEE